MRQFYAGGHLGMIPAAFGDAMQFAIAPWRAGPF